VNDEIRRFEIQVHNHPEQAVDSGNHAQMVRVQPFNRRDFLRGISQTSSGLKEVFMWAFALPGTSDASTTVHLAADQNPPADSVWVTVKRGERESDWAIRKIDGKFYRFQKRYLSGGMEVRLDDQDTRILKVRVARARGGKTPPETILVLPESVKGEVLAVRFSEGQVAVQTSIGMQYLFGMKLNGLDVELTDSPIQRQTLDLKDLLAESREFGGSCDGDLSR
jgi:hypothetical protein